MGPFFLSAVPPKRRSVPARGLPVLLFLALWGGILSGCVPFWQGEAAPQPETPPPAVISLEQGEQVVTQPPQPGSAPSAGQHGDGSGLSTEALSR